MKLLPCPFCSSSGSIKLTGTSSLQVECENCGARGPYAGTNDGAVRYWNDTKLLEQVNTLRARNAEFVELVCSAKSIAEREGVQTNWEAFIKSIDDLIIRADERKNHGSR